MIRTITKVKPIIPELKSRKRVAAYARISMDTERMMHSLSAQVSHYSVLIQKNSEWEYVGVYADTGISGTGTKKRAGFKQMIKDCKAGCIDIIITKSISRFARNTVDLLKTVRELKIIGIKVIFEKEHIDSFSGDGELMLTILASFAQEESRSISDNVKWGIRKKYQRGESSSGAVILGYRRQNSQYIIHDEEAAVVQNIFRSFACGNSPRKIAKNLNQEGHTSVRNKMFSAGTIKSILQNITYIGDLLLQKTYVADVLTKRVEKNKGVLPQYYVEENHPAIISKELFEAVQQERKRRTKLGTLANQAHNYTCFTRKIRCNLCGKFYNRNDHRGYVAWVCETRRKHGDCTAKYLPEEKLKEVCADVLELMEFDEAVFCKAIKLITVPAHHELVFHFYDGREIKKHWESKGHKGWWTKENREKHQMKCRNRVTNPGVLFSTKVKCGRCGRNYRRITSHYADGTIGHFWRCMGRKKCPGSSLQEDILKECIVKALHTTIFDKALYEEKIDHIEVMSDEKMDIVFKDSSKKSVSWVPIIRKPWGKETEYGKKDKNNTCND